MLRRRRIVAKASVVRTDICTSMGTDQALGVEDVDL